MRQFYDGKKRPDRTPAWDYIDDDIDRICLNCNKQFGEHQGYMCLED